GTRERERAALAVRVTGLTFATSCSQLGRAETGTNTELANTSGDRTTKTADWAASALRTVSATKAKIQLSARPKALTSAMHTRAGATPAWRRKPMMYPTTIISTTITTLRTKSATVRPMSTADRAIGIERKRPITPSFRASDRPTPL